MLTRSTTLIAFISLISVLVICSGTVLASEETLLDKNFGRSLESIRYLQTFDPEAEKNLDPVVGLDGNASVNNVEKYQNSFKEAEQRESTTILNLQ